MRISQIRRQMYRGARLLGDVQAGKRAVEERSAAPIVQRVERVVVGRLIARILGALFRPR